MVEVTSTINKNFVPDFEKKLDENLRAAADGFLVELTQELPIETGEMVANTKVRKIRSSKKNPGGGYKIVTDFAEFFYEYGTLDGAGKERQPARPVTAPALARDESKIIDTITRDLL